MNLIKKHMNFLVLAASLLMVGLDQLFKDLAIRYLSPIETYPLIQDVLHLTYLENRGAAFGIFEGRTFWLVGVTGAVVLVLIVLLVLNKIHSPMLMWAMGLIIGGGIGNLIDRIFRGYVVDYIHLKFIHFAIFNFADCCVVIGTALLVIYFLFFEGKKVNAARTKGASGQEQAEASKPEEEAPAETTAPDTEEEQPSSEAAEPGEEPAGGDENRV